MCDFWKQRYEVLKGDLDMVLKENADLFSTVREIKAHATLGDIMSAIIAINDLAERRERYSKPDQTITRQEGQREYDGIDVESRIRGQENPYVAIESS